MPDLFQDHAADWDTRPVPQQISEGVYTALTEAIRLDPSDTVMDFGAGTGLLAGRVAPHVGRLVAVDVSPAMTACTVTREGAAYPVFLLTAVA